MKFNKQTIIILLILASPALSCKKYLDVVPDNIATIEYAFRMRTTAKKYLYTCYSYIPNQADISSGFMFTGDDMWYPSYPNGSAPWEIARGSQNINSPYLDYWNGAGANKPMWRGLRECNIFLENVELVPDLDSIEKEQWIAEVKFLKAYYHFFLMTLYGPIPVIRNNLSIAAGVDDVKVTRRPVDEVVDYIVELLDEASEGLPNAVQDPMAENGRITLPIAKALKAKVLVYAASPLFNGNPDYSGFINKDGTQLFSQTSSPEKWQKAANACKEAIDLCESLGYELYKFTLTNQTLAISEETKIQMNVRNSFTERWNSEVIWADPNSYTATIQNQSTPRYDLSVFGNSIIRGNWGVPLKVVSQFYTKNGLPINEDKTWSYASRFNLRTATVADKYCIKPDYVTAAFNFDREPRFYATFGFDGGIWYGQGKYDDNDTYVLQCKVGQPAGKTNPTGFAASGYYPKKYVYYTNIASTTANTNTITDYPWVLMRLSDLYLLYAEAINEAEGPANGEAYKYLNLIRERAGIPTVEDAWTNFSTNPSKFTSKEGLRDIIHRERYIELALEGHRRWDVRRWKEAPVELTKPITGWDVDQETSAAYYREKVIFRPTFTLKDYFWPIREYDLIINKNLVQNPGW